MIEIAPSLLAADFANLETEVIKVENAGADMLHLDIMDGHFVDNLSFGVPVIKALRSKTKLLFDVHLMVNNPEKMLTWFADAGADFITIHAEAVDDLSAVIKKIHDLGIKAGVALKPATSADVLQKVIDQVDLILVMTVEPGFGGQKFMDDMMDKVSVIKNMFAGRKILLGVDGGINGKTAQLAKKAGANMLVAGTYVFGADDCKEAIASLR